MMLKFLYQENLIKLELSDKGNLEEVKVGIRFFDKNSFESKEPFRNHGCNGLNDEIPRYDLVKIWGIIRTSFTTRRKKRWHKNIVQVAKRMYVQDEVGDIGNGTSRRVKTS